MMTTHKSRITYLILDDLLNSVRNLVIGNLTVAHEYALKAAEEISKLQGELNEG